MNAHQGGRLVETVPLAGDGDVALARRAVGRLMEDLNARTIARTRFVTAVSEIARNAVLHGRGGVLHVYAHDADGRVSVVCRDEGPGIADVSRALKDGFTTGDGLGRGLGGAQRLSATFDIETAPGAGTCVRMMGRG